MSCHRAGARGRGIRRGPRCPATATAWRALILLDTIADCIILDREPTVPPIRIVRIPDLMLQPYMIHEIHRICSGLDPPRQHRLPGRGRTSDFRAICYPRRWRLIRVIFAPPELDAEVVPIRVDHTRPQRPP